MWLKYVNRMLMKERVRLNESMIEVNSERSYGMGLGNDYEDDEGDDYCKVNIIIEVWSR